LNKPEDYQISTIINHRFSLRAKSSIQTKRRADKLHNGAGVAAV